MTQTEYILPPRLQEIVEEFKLCDREEKLELLLEYSDRMPPLPDHLQNQHETMEQVHECMTPVFVRAEMENGGMVFFFDVPPEAPTVRGYAAVLREGLHGATPEEVMNTPAQYYEQMGLQHVLGPQRLNGITAMLVYMKRLAFAQTRNK